MRRRVGTGPARDVVRRFGFVPGRALERPIEVTFTLAPDALVIGGASPSGAVTYVSSTNVTMSVRGDRGYISPRPGSYNPFNATDVLLHLTYGAQADAGDGG